MEDLVKLCSVWMSSHALSHAERVGYRMGSQSLIWTVLVEVILRDSFEY